MKEENLLVQKERRIWMVIVMLSAMVSSIILKDIKIVVPNFLVIALLLYLLTTDKTKTRTKNVQNPNRNKI